MLKVFLSGHLKSFSGGETELSLSNEYATVGEALDSLWLRCPALRDRILNEQGQIRQHVNVFYMGQDVRRANGLDTGVAPEGELHIFNAVSGG
jgi:sulfur-carrier protein